MRPPADAQLLRVFISENDRFGKKRLYRLIVEKARERGLAGATVLKGVLGFGAHSHIHTARVLRISEDLPLVIEIVDEPEKIQAFLPILDAMMDEGLITLEQIKVIAYRDSHGGLMDGDDQDDPS